MSFVSTTTSKRFLCHRRWSKWGRGWGRPWGHRKEEYLMNVWNQYENNWGNPPYSVNDNDKTFSVSVDLPGVKASDMKIKLLNHRVLQLSGERKHETGNNYFGNGSFKYRFGLDDNVDGNNLTASLTDGVLQIVAPKFEFDPSKDGKEIEIQERNNYGEAAADAVAVEK